ncbi:MAG TPA: hypothetical protein ENH05_07365 [Rhizobiales bacterium]|nr:hypothetical protein [Hyphomicrobiales bacterium]
MMQIQGAQDRSRQTSQVAKSESRAIIPVPDTLQHRRAPPGASRNRRASAFLAHLALQYDGVSVRRKQRAERLDAAIRSYGAEAAMRNAPRIRPASDLKI